MDQAALRPRRPRYIHAVGAGAVAFALGLSGCAQPQHAQSGGPASLTAFEVTSRGQDGGGAFCADFSLDAAQARAFLARAQVLDARRLHDGFELLPCWVRGSARSDLGLWQWEVRAGGSARLVAPDGAVTLLGCKRCDDMLRGTSAPAPR